jgi:hypothetical protein
VAKTAPRLALVAVTRRRTAHLLSLALLLALPILLVFVCDVLASFLCSSRS